ncbi:taste receptor type 2 member 60 [Cynocephalus volans]|uniref:taste receptor type 2 member 60 n=1 Tax=Cynocephalus volans TaxID=110931 RepID=UPI002FCB6A34
MSGDDMVPGPLATDTKAIILAVIFFLSCLVAVVGNGFITAVLSTEWLLRRTLPPCDKLLLSLGASRFCLQWVVMGKNIYIFLYPMAFPYNPVLQFLGFQWDFLNAATLWFSTWLSVFYCVKIATFAHPVFLWLKRKLSTWVPWMFLSSVGLSSLSTILLFIGNQKIYQNYVRTGLRPWNMTRNSIMSSYEKFYLFPLKVITWTVPTVVFLICMVLLITSLGRHTKKAFLTVSGFRELGAQVHVKALLALVSFAILFVSYFLSLVLSTTGIFQFGELRYWMWQAAIYLCTAVHPIILLLSHPRLRAVLERGCSSRCVAS